MNLDLRELDSTINTTPNISLGRERVVHLPPSRVTIHINKAVLAVLNLLQPEFGCGVIEQVGKCPNRIQFVLPRASTGTLGCAAQEQQILNSNNHRVAIHASFV
jgi:hypothetical protein